MLEKTASLFGLRDGHVGGEGEAKLEDDGGEEGVGGVEEAVGGGGEFVVEALEGVNAAEGKKGREWGEEWGEKERKMEKKGRKMEENGRKIH